MTEIRIPTEEFQRRRQAALDALDGAIGVLFAGTIGELNETFRPRLHFEYLTGITSESGAILILDPEHPIEARRVSRSFAWPASSAARTASTTPSGVSP